MTLYFFEHFNSLRKRRELNETYEINSYDSDSFLTKTERRMRFEAKVLAEEQRCSFDEKNFDSDDLSHNSKSDNISSNSVVQVCYCYLFTIVLIYKVN